MGMGLSLGSSRLGALSPRSAAAVRAQQAATFLRRSLTLRQAGASSSSMDALLDQTAYTLTEQHIQVAHVPHQRSDYAAYYAFHIHESMRAVHEAQRWDSIRDPRKLLGLFALSFSNLDVERAVVGGGGGGGGCGGRDLGAVRCLVERGPARGGARQV